ncbi:hypothetical protein [Selenomonas ruminantium]|uniref:hypothetical protein n=1 Tax=Selenomonas ruminantium TaxID=971 RepID=UPI00047E2D8B|nr:hypothetical protein [Selenomonas ruminantium]
MCNKDKDGTNWYFCVAFITIFLVSAIRFPLLSFCSEVWAEQGTNYLLNAMEKGIIDNLMITDAGYLVIYPRIIALLAYHIFPLKCFPYLTNIAGLLHISFFLSFFCCRDFRSVLFSDRTRFVICLFFGLIVIPNFENFTFVNWVYHGIFFCMLLLFGNLEGWDNKKYWFFMILSAVLSASKFHFLLFFPVYCLFSFYHLYKKRWKTGMFFIPSICMMLVQVISVVKHMSSDSFIVNSTSAHLSIYETINRMVNSLFWCIQYYAPGCTLILSFFVFMLGLYVIYKGIKNSYISCIERNFILLCLYVACSYRSISSLSHFLFYLPKPLNSGMPSLSRVDFLSYDLILMVEILLVIMVCRVYKDSLERLEKAGLFLLIICLHASTFGQMLYNLEDFRGIKYEVKLCMYEHGMIKKQPDNIYAQLFVNSTWLDYYPLLKEKAFFIPINPGLDDIERWSIRRGVAVLLKTDSIEGDKISLTYDESVSGICSIYVEYPAIENIKVQAYNEQHLMIAEVGFLNNKNSIRKYFYFEDDICPAYLKIVRENGADIDFNDCKSILVIGR